MTIQSMSFPKKSLIGWWFFDFGYSIATVIGGIYFTKWFTENLNASSKLLNSLFLISAIIIFLTGKQIGRKVDLKGYRFWLILSTCISFLSILLLYISSQLFSASVLIPLSFFLFVLFLFGYQVGRICHNVYLKKVIPTNLQSRMSGYGVAANWAGSIIGIAATIPVVTTKSISVMDSRELTFLVAAGLFGIISFISLFYMLRSREHAENLTGPELKNKGLRETLLLYFGIFFIIYFLLYDVMTIVQRNLPSYLSQVFTMPDSTQAQAFLIILFSAMVGGIISAKILNYGNSINWLKGASFNLGVAILLITLQNDIALWSAFAIAGISYGIIESAIRVNFMGRFPPKLAGENFGTLAIVERASGVAGPVLWIAAFSFSSDATNSYKISMVAMSSLAFLAFILLFFTKKTRNQI